MNCWNKKNSYGRAENERKNNLTPERLKQDKDYIHLIIRKKWVVS